MRPPPKPAKKFLAGSSLRSPDPAQRKATPAPSEPTPPAQTLSMTKSAIRKREERAKRANARQYARSIVGVPSLRFHSGENAEKPKKVKSATSTPKRWKVMPADAVERQSTQQQRREEFENRQFGGESTTPEGAGTTPSNERTRFDVRLPETLTILNQYENRFEKLRNDLANLKGEDTRRTIIQDMAETVFEEHDDKFHCKACAKIEPWKSRTTTHLEDVIESEIITYLTARKRAEDMEDGYRRLAMQSGMTPIAVVPPVIGPHARLFVQHVQMHKRHAAEVRKALKKSKTCPSEALENTGT